MSIYHPHPDLGTEVNAARRLFWEKCASRTPTYREETGYEGPDDVAKWADYMLTEWNKRWIIEACDDEPNSTINANEISTINANEILP